MNNMNEHDFLSRLQSLQHMNFNNILNEVKTEIVGLPENKIKVLFQQLKKGINILESHEQLIMYLFAYGKMHYEKLDYTFLKFKNKINFNLDNKLNIIDWGCGQGIATIIFFDFLKKIFNVEPNSYIDKIYLIEPSAKAIERAKFFVELYNIDPEKIHLKNIFFENINIEEFSLNADSTTLHLFSNILDIEHIDLKELARKVTTLYSNNTYIITVGPLNRNNKRLDRFFDYFDYDRIEIIFEEENPMFGYNQTNNQYSWTYKGKILNLLPDKAPYFKEIKYYPAVQFHAAYLSDYLYKKYETNNDFKIITAFEVYAPFDIGAIIYDDIEPVLAVMQNIIVRGIPTRASIFIEEKLSEILNITEKKEYLGEINFELKDNNNQNNELIKNIPIAIAWFQKVLIEVIIANKLDLNKDKLKILVKEQDLPVAALALEDFITTFNNLLKLVDQYLDGNKPKYKKFPQIDLTIINKNYKKTDFHLQYNVFINPTISILEQEYDLVIDFSFYKKYDNDTFTEFKAKDNSYFLIRKANKISAKRQIYTSERIIYKPLTELDNKGRHVEIKENAKILEYFLQLLFRKKEFRPGQLPILNRAMQIKNVIGFLPTGGGKSLTYQLASLLQPGITVIIDPLISLMFDQVRGLKNVGIDASVSINSQLDTQQKKQNLRKVENSEVMFVFMSPERLAIEDFREQLKNMQNLNVYFSYGVIDEVHCVSEWGHDFRYSYLHVGRNLYNFIKPKTDHITLFGLTATASFDVLADVERELSGEGQFPLDAEAIVRYEHTNRLELQYYIKPVEINYKIHKSNNNMLPSQLKIADKWEVYQQKSQILTEIIKEIPDLFNKINNKKNIELIKKRFIERLNLSKNDPKDKEQIELINNANISESLNKYFYKTKEIYDQAGIIFSPHKNSSGIAVNELQPKLIKDLNNDAIGKFHGGDDTGESIQNLDNFIENKQPIMIATKAFGMGIDKPNIRFTIHLNYPSSLESFVQEAGRAGRDRKMSIAVILFSTYNLVRIKPIDELKGFPFTHNDEKGTWFIKGKWYKPEVLEQTLNDYKHDILNIKNDFFENRDKYIDVLDPNRDIIRIVCNEHKNFKNEAKYFDFENCDYKNCSYFKNCQLKKLPKRLENWQYSKYLYSELEKENIKIDGKYFEYENTDFETVYFFYNESFKGTTYEKKYINTILNNIQIEYNNSTFPNLLQFLQHNNQKIEQKSIYINIKYKDSNFSDISKSLYRLIVIGFLEDYTIDYKSKTFKIEITKKSPEEYYNKLKQYLMRYTTEQRAEEEIIKAKAEYKVKAKNEFEEAIYKTLAYLIDFIYEKIAIKRRRGIDDMRNFCLTAINSKDDWIEVNEKLKDYLYYYFNSKYIREDYVAPNDEPYSILKDTNDSRWSNKDILFKYLRIIEQPVLGTDTEIDNVKHLYGSVRLLMRSMTFDNPTILLLNVFCLILLGTKDNENLKNDLIESYKNGMLGFLKDFDDINNFYNNVFNPFNLIIINNNKDFVDIDELISETNILCSINMLNLEINKTLQL